MPKSKKLTSAQAPKNKKKSVTYPRVAGDAVVSQKMLYSVRDEMISHAEKKFQETEVRFHEVKAEIHEVKAIVARLEKSYHNMALLLEEQNNRNKIVLDGLSHLFERQERIENKLNTSL
jgi:hypothetical protein